MGAGANPASHQDGGEIVFNFYRRGDIKKSLLHQNNLFVDGGIGDNEGKKLLVGI